MKILLLCTHETTYVLQLYRYMKKYYPNIKYSLFTKESAKPYYQRHLELQKGESIYTFGAHDYLCCVEAKKLPHFDIIHSLWMEQFWGEAAHILRRKCDAWFCSVGGSDLYRQSNKLFFRILQKRIISRADWISSEGEETKEYFEKVYKMKGRKTPHTIVRFGVDILDCFDEIHDIETGNLKKKYDIPSDKIVVMCGTNGRKEHQHMKMLEAIEKLPEAILNNCCLLFPMTYGGNEDYIRSVQDRALSITKNSVVLREFLTTAEMAEVASITDIMIHVQTTDQLSSAMLSHMYHGNVVIAGSWLPYHTLREKGIMFISVNRIDEITEQLMEVVPNIEEWKRQCSFNAEIVYHMSSWENSAREWYYVYNQLTEKNEGRI